MVVDADVVDVVVLLFDDDVKGLQWIRAILNQIFLYKGVKVTKTKVKSRILLKRNRKNKGFNYKYTWYDWKDLTFDHLLPKSKGGLTDWNNVVTACSSCNVKKGGKLFKDCDSNHDKCLHPEEALKAPSCKRNCAILWLYSFIVKKSSFFESSTFLCISKFL